MEWKITLHHQWKTYVCTCFDKELRTATILYANKISETKYRCKNERAIVSRGDWLYNYVYKHLLLQIFKAAFNLMFLYTASTTATGTTESVSSAATTETVASSTVGETTQTAETTSEGKWLPFPPDRDNAPQYNWVNIYCR